MLKEITVSFFLQEICEPGAIRMRVPECQFNFLRILKMRNKILVHFHFSFLWKIENDFSTHFSKLIFYFFVKTKMKSFRFLFSNFRKKWKFNEFIFQFSKKTNKMEILFLSLLFNFGTKGKVKFIANSIFIASLMSSHSWWPRDRNAPIMWCLLLLQIWLIGILPSTCMVVISRGEGEGRIKRKLKNEFVKFQFSFFFQNWIMNLKVKFPFYFYFLENWKMNSLNFNFNFFSKIWKKKSKNLPF